MKGRIAEFFKAGQAGEEIIAQIPAVSLSTPGFSRDSSAGKLPSAVPSSQWARLKDQPVRFLDEIRQFLAPLNLRDFPHEQRMELTDRCRDSARMVINAAYNERLTSNQFPLPEAQKNLLDASITLTEQLLISYKHSFRKALDAVRLRRIDAVLDTRLQGFNILECFSVLQRMYACKHKALPRHSWSELNQVFYVLWKLQDIHTQYPLSGYLRNLKRPSETEVVYTGEQPKTALQLFLSLQLFGLCDGFTWSANSLHLIDAYVAMLKDRRIVEDLIPDTPVEAGKLPVSFNQDRPASPQVRPDRNKAALVIDIFEFHKLVATDHRALAGNAPQKISPALATIALTDRRPMIDFIHKKLQAPERQSTRIPARSKQTVRMHLGFRNSHFPASKGDSELYRRYLKSRLLTEMLAETSAGITTDEAEHEASKWIIANESEGGMLVETRITKYTNEVFQGQLVAYQKLGGDKPTHPQLGYVNRIQHLDDDTLKVAVTRIAGHAEAVFLRSLSSADQQRASIGFLACDDKNNWMLILHSVFAVEPGTKLSMERGNKHQKVCIGAPVLSMQEFVCHLLRNAD